jgi:hypothetical protein
MITLALVALTLTIGLISLAYGLDEDYPPFDDNKTPDFCKSLKYSNQTEDAPDCTKR